MKNWTHYLKITSEFHRITFLLNKYFKVSLIFVNDSIHSCPIKIFFFDKKMQFLFESEKGNSLKSVIK
jgi:hypothetical protein